MFSVREVSVVFTVIYFLERVCCSCRVVGGGRGEGRGEGGEEGVEMRGVLIEPQ